MTRKYEQKGEGWKPEHSVQADKIVSPHQHLLMLRKEHKLTLTEISERIQQTTGTSKYNRRQATRWVSEDWPTPGWVPLILGLSLLWDGRITFVEFMRIVKRARAHT